MVHLSATRRRESSRRPRRGNPARWTMGQAGQPRTMGRAGQPRTRQGRGRRIGPRSALSWPRTVDGRRADEPQRLGRRDSAGRKCAGPRTWSHVDRWRGSKGWGRSHRPQPVPLPGADRAVAVALRRVRRTGRSLARACAASVGEGFQGLIRGPGRGCSCPGPVLSRRSRRRPTPQRTRSASARLAPSRRRVPPQCGWS